VIGDNFMPTSIIAYGGVNKIGSNKVLIEDKNPQHFGSHFTDGVRNESPVIFQDKVFVTCLVKQLTVNLRLSIITQKKEQA
ncbi:hypothetical protein ACFLQL_04525, partial [Verrucomicrobiota bacterium]